MTRCQLPLPFPFCAPAAALATLVICAACAETVAPVAPIAEMPLVTPAPVRAVVVYADGLRNHECTASKGYIAESFVFRLGPPTIATFDPIFRGLFKEVVVAEPGAKPAGPPSDHVVVELQLARFTGCQASWPIFNTTAIEIAYEAVVKSADNTDLTRWAGRGISGPGDDLEPYLTPFSFEAGHLAALTSLAMRKAAADFIINAENDLVVQGWKAQ